MHCSLAAAALWCGHYQRLPAQLRDLFAANAASIPRASEMERRMLALALALALGAHSEFLTASASDFGGYRIALGSQKIPKLRSKLSRFCGGGSVSCPSL